MTNYGYIPWRVYLKLPINSVNKLMEKMQEDNKPLEASLKNGKH
jgi:hypothetical protein